MGWIAPEGGLPLALARGLAVAAMLSAFGSLVFRVWVLPKGAELADRSLRLLARWSLWAAALWLMAWAGLQTIDLAQTGGDLGRFLTAWPVVVTGTAFGHVWLAQFLIVIAAGSVVLRRPNLGLGLSLAAVLLQAGHSHALSMYGGPSILLASEAVHLVAAGAWLGGLFPLLLVVHGMPPREGALAARWFTPLGKWCVAGIVGSAGLQFWALIGGVPGLVGTPYGTMALVKLGLLLVLLGFAVVNRYRLAPALLGAGPDAKRMLVRSVAVQTGVGVAVVLAAGVLAGLPPSMHEQPVWPFAWRPSLVALDDADLAREVWTGVGMLALAAVVVVGLVSRRVRRVWPVVVLTAGGVGWFAWPHLALLLVEAYPTSYYRSPTGFAATSIVEGSALFLPNCAGCHGIGGRGDGPAAAGLAVPPADLTASHLWEHSDGELYWWLSRGMVGADGSLVMPGFAGRLPPEQLWALIDAVRALNAGTAMRATGAWPHALAVPGFDLICPGRGDVTTGDLLGRVLYIVAGGTGVVLPAGDVTGVLLTNGGNVGDWAGCVASDPAAWTALAVLSGQTKEGFAGSRLLVDGAGWLRTMRDGAGAAVWDDRDALAAAVGAIRSTPLVVVEERHVH